MPTKTKAQPKKKLRQIISVRIPRIYGEHSKNGEEDPALHLDASTKRGVADATAAKALTVAIIDARTKNPARFWLKFWKRISRQDSGCWLWTGAKAKHGYGMVGFRKNGKFSHVLAHRIAYVSTGATLRQGEDCLHSCDVPACVNPAHLRAGNQRENISDMYRRGRDIWTKRTALSLPSPATTPMPTRLQAMLGAVSRG